MLSLIPIKALAWIFAVIAAISWWSIDGDFIIISESEEEVARRENDPALKAIFNLLLFLYVIAFTVLFGYMVKNLMWLHGHFREIYPLTEW